MEFAHIGKSCSYCNSQDFLPFTCDCCSSVFCLEHRSYVAHNCKRATGKDHRVISCPLCTKSIHFFEDGSSANVHEVFDKHLRLECTNREGTNSTAKSATTTSSSSSAANAATKAPKRCCAKGCRDTLTTSNTFYCPKCRQESCLKHRFSDAHECGTSRGVGGNPNPSILLSSSTSSSSSSSTTSSSSTKTSSLPSSVSSTSASSNNQSVPFFATRSAQPPSRNFDMRAQLRETAHRRGAAGGREVANYNNSSGGSGGGGDRLEPCSHCGAAFDDPVALVNHVSTAHSGGESERCTTCGQVFPDVSALISHTEATHADKSSCSII